ncbi:MAG: hypothetical protein JST86_20310 [Bacteroidetes bacterium]|nr:hypothetical protein [Bacteroidota bacterium]
MKHLFFVACLISLTGLNGFSQNLSGVWKGKMDVAAWFFEQRINFVFIKINDSAYRAYSNSYMPGDSDSSMCLMQGVLIKHTLYLEEKEIIKYYHNDTSATCKQLMKLTFIQRKKKAILMGDWYTDEDKCGHGTITLTKRDD